MIKKTSIILISLFALALASGSSYAADFTTSYKVIYDVKEDATTSVVQTLVIKNLSNKIFASNYNLRVSNLKIFNVKAYDDNGEIETEVTNKDSDTLVKVTFEDQVIGAGKELKWNLSYETNDIATKNGNVLDVNIPKISTLSNVSNYDVFLKVEEKFGPSMFISPDPISSSKEGGKNVYAFSLQQIQNSPITASFGSYQVFNFRLTYHISNEGSFLQKSDIAFPPDITIRQQILYKSLSHTPSNLQIDEDGNYIATYEVSPKSELSVTLTGSARVLNRRIRPEEGGQFEDIPANIKSAFTRRQKYWNTDDDRIKEQAAKLKDESLTVSQNAQKAYNYVIESLDYREEKNANKTVVRLGSSKALDHSDQAICMEFVDLFIAVARKMGIPARELNGFAFSYNQALTPLSINLKGGDVLHSWAEYFDPEFGWVPIDPTWGATSGLDFFSKLDTNHLTFVIKGISSEFPLPAGSYKTPSDDKPQVDVSFAEDQTVFESAQPDVSIHTGKFDNPLGKFTSKRKITVLNVGPVTLFNINGSNKSLPPFFSMETYAKLDQEFASIEHDNFEGIKLTLSEKTSEPITQSRGASGLSYWNILLLTLGLYATLYFLITQKEDLQKLVSRLSRRLRGRDR